MCWRASINIVWYLGELRSTSLKILLEMIISGRVCSLFDFIANWDESFACRVVYLSSQASGPWPALFSEPLTWRWMKDKTISILSLIEPGFVFKFWPDWEATVFLRSRDSELLVRIYDLTREENWGCLIWIGRRESSKQFDWLGFDAGV